MYYTSTGTLALAFSTRTIFFKEKSNKINPYSCCLSSTSGNRSQRIQYNIDPICELAANTNWEECRKLKEKLGCLCSKCSGTRLQDVLCIFSCFFVLCQTHPCVLLTLPESSAVVQLWSQACKSGSRKWPPLLWNGSVSSDSMLSECLCVQGPLHMKGRNKAQGGDKLTDLKWSIDGINKHNKTWSHF